MKMQHPVIDDKRTGPCVQKGLRVETVQSRNARLGSRTKGASEDRKDRRQPTCSASWDFPALLWRCWVPTARPAASAHSSLTIAGSAAQHTAAQETHLEICFPFKALSPAFVRAEAVTARQESTVVSQFYRKKRSIIDRDGGKCIYSNRGDVSETSRKLSFALSAQN